MVVAVACLVGYIVAGFTQNVIFTFLSGLATLAAIIAVIKMTQKKA